MRHLTDAQLLRAARRGTNYSGGFAWGMKRNEPELGYYPCRGEEKEAQGVVERLSSLLGLTLDEYLTKLPIERARIFKRARVKA